MNTLILLIDRNEIWSPEKWLMTQEGCRNSDGQVVIERGDEWISLVRDDQVLDDFDDSERTCVDQMIVDPDVYLIEWKGAALVEKLLRAIPPEVHAVVDNDHGLILRTHDVAGEPLGTWVNASTWP